MTEFPTLESTIGNTPLVQVQRITPVDSNTYLLKLEGNNPAGSVKDRPAKNMILQAELAGKIKPGDTLIEATSGNTGIALAMIATIKGYKMILIMPDNMTAERRATMSVYGAEIVMVTEKEGMEGARDLALEMQKGGKGLLLDQFSNENNPEVHFNTTGPEIWLQSQQSITHFVSSMGTTGTIMGVSQYLKGMNSEIEIVGVRPLEGASIPGIRRWPKEYLPSIFEEGRVDKYIDVSQDEAESTAKRLAADEGLFCGVSSGGAFAAALRLGEGTENSVIVTIICDRGDRYLSSGVFS